MTHRQECDSNNQSPEGATEHQQDSLCCPFRALIIGIASAGVGTPASGLASPSGTFIGNLKFL